MLTTYKHTQSQLKGILKGILCSEPMELASRQEIWLPDFCHEFLFLDFVFDRETTVASEEGWVWVVVFFNPTSSEKFFKNPHT